MVSLPKARGITTATSAGGKIYSMGGFNESDSYQANVYAYDPQQPGLGWQSVSNLPTPLVRTASTVVGDKIYVIGGGATNGAHAGVYEYDSSQPAQGWRHLNNLPDTRENLAATSLNGKLYAFGGYNPGGFYSNAYVCDLSHPELGWASISNMPAARYAQAAVALNGKIYIVGGFNASQTGVNTVYMYDPSRPTQGWLSVSNLPSVKGEAPGVVVNGKIYVISGASAPLTYQSTVYEGSISPGITPSSGSILGGTTVTIKGINLGNGGDVTNVTLCGVPVSAIISQSATQVVVTTGASVPTTNGAAAVFSVSYGVTVASNVFSYIADQPVAPVALAATATTISGFSANWSAVGGVDNYRLDLSTSSNFTSYVSGYSNINVGLVVTFPISGLNAGTTYFYRVRAQKSGVSSTNSATIQTMTESGSVNLSNGPAAGGTVLVITGVGLGDGSDITNVTVCGVVAKIQNQTSNSVTVIVGPGGIGTGDVVVRSASRGSITLAGAYTYNPQGHITGDVLRWGSVSNLPVARGLMGAAEVGSKIYAMGGYNSGWYATAYCYDTTIPTQGWKSMSSLPKARGVLTAVSVGGKVYSIGGFNEGDGYQSDVYVYDPLQSGLGWLSVSNLPVALVRHSSAVANGKIYVLGGGATNGEQSAVYEYDPLKPAQGWRLFNNLPSPRVNIAAATLDGKIYAVGGLEGSTLQSSVYVCDPLHAELGWLSVSNLPVALHVMSAATLNGKLFAIGGFRTGNIGVSTVYMYDPNMPAQGWLSVSNLPSAKGEAPAVVVDGKIYVISGASAAVTYQSTVYEGSVTPGVTPPSGPVSGGTTVTINGSNLGNGSDITSVTLCGVPVSAILSQSATQVVVTAGASAVAGMGDVAVYSTSYGVTSRSNVFTYIRTHIITASAGPNGSIVPSGEISVMEGQGTNFVVTASEGRHIVSLLVDGESVGSFGPGSNRYEYMFQNVTTGHTICATFYNYPPVAHSMTVTTALDNATAVELTGSDEDGDTLSFNVTVPPAFGTLTGTGALRIYTPAPDFIGEDSFRYTADDGRTNSEEAVVTIKVIPALQKMKIQFSGYTRGEALTNFPLLVVFNPTTLTNGFSYHRFASPQGFDLRFTDASGITNLNYEVEAWNTNGTSSVWVQVPVLTNGGSIWAWWGDRNLADTPPACTTNGSTWDAKFKAVWHLGEGSGNAQDSTSARNQGTLIDSVVRTNGKVAGGAGFDGGTGEFAVNSTFGLGRFSVTLEAMAYVEPGKNGAFLKVGDNSSGFGFGIGGNFLQDAGQNYRLLFEGARWIQPSGTVPTGWHHFAMVVSATGVPTAVLDGVSVGTFTGSNANAPTGSISHIGGYLNTNQGSYQRHYNGVLDEIRIAAVPRSTNWLWACWRNVSSNAVFNPCGAIVPGGKDSHGVPDEWKMRYFGGTGMPDADSLDDCDHDGMINLHEFQAGTNPTNPVSRLEIKSQGPALDGTNLLLRWSSVAGKFYSVDVGTNLMEGFPIHAATNVPATPEVNTCTIRVDRTAQKFFRVHVEP